MIRRSPRVAAVLALALGCMEPAASGDKVVEPRRKVHPGTREPELGGDAVDDSTPGSTKRDPKIDRALASIRSSRLRFLAPDVEKPDEPGDEYTAEQFISMLESKRDWIGYDIVEFDPWLTEIATGSFMDRTAYLVVLDDGTTREFRPWLLEQLAAPP